MLKPSKKKNATELFEWMFGSPSKVPIITDSRDLSRLGDVVASKEGLKALRKTRSLEEGLMASGGIRDRLVKRLMEAQVALEKAEADIEAFAEDETVRETVARCREVLERLEASLG